MLEACPNGTPSHLRISYPGRGGPGGAGAVAFTLADGIAYVERRSRRTRCRRVRPPPVVFLYRPQRTSWRKWPNFRAARRVWAHIMRTAFGAKHPKAGCPLPNHRPAARRPHSAQSADNNIIASRCRPSPRCSAARSRCTPIARRALASPPGHAVPIPLAPSRSSPMSRRCARRWTRVAGSLLFETQRPHREGSAQ